MVCRTTCSLGRARVVDIVDPLTRSRMMARVKSRNTGPETEVRSLLHRAGYRFRLGNRKLPGAPDLVMPRYRVAVYVHGCFWHGHGCHLFKMPATRRDFWSTKIGANRNRDEHVRSSVEALGWRHIVIWECALRGKHRLRPDALVRELRSILEQGKSGGVIRGGG